MPAVDISKILERRGITLDVYEKCIRADERWRTLNEVDKRLSNAFDDKDIRESIHSNLEHMAESNNEEMGFPATFEKFVEEYSFKDKDEVYTNGSELIPTFRVMQGYEHFANKIREEERKRFASNIEWYLLVNHSNGTMEQQYLSNRIIDYIKKLIKEGEQNNGRIC